MALTTRIRRGLGLVWRSVVSAVSRGQSSFETATQAQQAFDSIGVSSSGITPGLIDEFTGYATSMENAAISLARAEGSQYIDASMIGTAPWSMSLAEFATSPSYHVRLGIWVEGQTEPVYRMVTGISDVGMPVDEFASMMRVNAEAMQAGTVPGGGIGGAVRGLASIQIAIAPPGA